MHKKKKKTNDRMNRSLNTTKYNEQKFKNKLNPMEGSNMKISCWIDMLIVYRETTFLLYGYVRMVNENTCWLL